MLACEEGRTGYLTRTAGLTLAKAVSPSAEKPNATCVRSSQGITRHERVCLGLKSHESNYNSRKPGSSLGR